MSPSEVQNALKLTQLTSKQLWYVQPTIATSGIGLAEGLSWLNANYRSR